MKIKETRIFFLSIGFVIAELLPFSKFFHFHYIVSLWKFVNKISQEPLKGTVITKALTCLKIYLYKQK